MSKRYGNTHLQPPRNAHVQPASKARHGGERAQRGQRGQLPEQHLSHLHTGARQATVITTTPALPASHCTTSSWHPGNHPPSNVFPALRQKIASSIVQTAAPPLRPPFQRQPSTATETCNAHTRQASHVHRAIATFVQRTDHEAASKVHSHTCLIRKLPRSTPVSPGWVDDME